MSLIDISVVFKLYYTYYSGSETRSRAFITSSSSVSGINPLSEEVAKFLVRKSNKMLSRTNFTKKYNISSHVKFASKCWGSRMKGIFKCFSGT